MNTELEIKLLNLDTNVLKLKIQSLGGVCVSERKLLRRQTFDFAEKLPVGKRFIRVRDQGKITITYKLIIDKNSIDGVKESEIVVENFDDTIEFLKSLGYIAKSYQENYREVWSLDGVEICFDEWPQLKPFVEIEGKSELAVREITEKLGLDFGEGLGGSVDTVYERELGWAPEKLNAMDNLVFEV